MPTANQGYDAEFFAQIEPYSLDSARVILPLACSLVRPATVLDVGCGRGAWLHVLEEELGVAEVFGIDGSYVDPGTLLFSKERFRAVDLTGPIPIDRRYGMAMCLEVAEHLPEKQARTLINALTSASDYVLFSAAVPGQTGTHHVNEQWPCYWQKLFLGHGYRMIDAIRPTIRDDQRVAWWYRQNVCLFVSPAGLKQLQERGAPCETKDSTMEWVHVNTLMGHMTVPSLVRALFQRVMHLGRFWGGTALHSTFSRQSPTLKQGRR